VRPTVDGTTFAAVEEQVRSSLGIEPESVRKPYGNRRMVPGSKPLDPCRCIPASTFIYHLSPPSLRTIQTIPNIEFRFTASPINGRNVNDLFVGILAANCPDFGGCYCCCTFPSPEEWMEKMCNEEI